MSRRTRNLRNRSVIIVESEDAQDRPVPSGCIDLTDVDADGDDDAIVDLTSSQSTLDTGANDTSVVVVGSTSGESVRSRDTDRLSVSSDEILTGASFRSRSPHSPRRHQRRSRNLPDMSDSDDSLIELPPAPFFIPTPSRSSQAPNVQSPDAIKITCPVCLDDDKTIKRNKKKLATTIKRDKKKLASTACGHVFCKECIDDCVRTNHQCPVCRKRLTSKQVHPLHI